MSATPKKINNNAVFALRYRLLLTTIGEAKVLKKVMRQEIDRVVRPILTARDCSLLAFDGGKNYVEIVFEAPPTAELTKLINSLKTATSRRIRNAFRYELENHSEALTGLWNKTYYLTTEQTMCVWQENNLKQAS